MEPTSEPLVFRTAVSDADWDAVYRLNYQVFVAETGLRPPTPRPLLLDPRLAESTCFLCLAGDALRGMVAISDVRPFSLDAKLPNLDSHLPRCTHPAEVRLLAVPPEYRHTAVLPGLVRQLGSCWRERGCDLLLCSAVPQQQRLYRHLGFRPFGPILHTDRLPLQAMFLTWAEVPDWALTRLGPD